MSDDADEKFVASARAGDSPFTWGLIPVGYRHYYKNEGDCNLVSSDASEFFEGSVDAFDNTVDGNHERTYVFGTNFGCACGKFRGRVLYWEGTLNELMKAVVGGK